MRGPWKVAPEPGPSRTRVSHAEGTRPAGEEHVSWEETLTRRHTCLRMEPSLPLHWGFCSSVASSVPRTFLFFRLTPSSPRRSVSSLSPHNQASFSFHPPWPRTRSFPHTPHLPTWRCHLPSHSGDSHGTLVLPFPLLPTSDLPGGPVSGPANQLKPSRFSPPPLPPPVRTACIPRFLLSLPSIINSPQS